MTKEWICIVFRMNDRIEGVLVSVKRFLLSPTSCLFGMKTVRYAGNCVRGVL